jgi:hypothetical protein
MFADLVGSVELGELLDVEDYRDLLSRFRNDVVAAVQRYDGFVARHQDPACSCTLAIHGRTKMMLKGLYGPGSP